MTLADGSPEDTVASGRSHGNGRLPSLLFVHIPRCGGMTFYYFLERIYGKSACVRFGDAISVEQLLYSDTPVPARPVVSGHLPLYQFKERLDTASRLVLAFVRNPSDRERSAAAYMMTAGFAEHQSAREKIAQGGIQALYDLPEYHNVQCSYFAESRRWDDAVERIVADGVLTFDSNASDLVAETLQQVAGSEIVPGRHNASKFTAEIDHAAFESIADEFCAEDRALHAWVKEKESRMLERLHECLGLI